MSDSRDAVAIAIRPSTSEADRDVVRSYLNRPGGCGLAVSIAVVAACILVIVFGLVIAAKEDRWLGAILAAFGVGALTLLWNRYHRQREDRSQWSAGIHTRLITLSDSLIDIQGVTNLGKAWSLFLEWPDVDKVTLLGDGLMITCSHGEIEFYVSPTWLEPGDFDRLLALLRSKLGARAKF